MTNTPKPPRMNGAVMPRSPHRAAVDGAARSASQIQAVLHVENRQIAALLADPSAMDPSIAAVAVIRSQHGGAKNAYRARQRPRFTHSAIS
jgi:hypothetical protein